jgi:hypothetical protein
MDEGTNECGGGLALGVEGAWNHESVHLSRGLPLVESALWGGYGELLGSLIVTGRVYITFEHLWAGGVLEGRSLSGYFLCVRPSYG